MVFENVLSQLLNRFLGDYVENLDGNQLSVGIWGGDVELKNLILKQSALAELDLPIQTIYGSLGRLVLKIPWKNLYSAATEICIEDVYLLAVPNQQVHYDPVKEEQRQFEAKQKEILKVEEAKKIASEIDKPKVENNTFIEKLTTQIIKNIQIKIKNIHIRYEDSVTAATPFALGITLNFLNMVSTDENWLPAITKDNVSKIYKILDLEGLAVYWNCATDSYVSLNNDDLIQRMTSEIATKNTKPANYTYVLGPINASARLRLNPKPEVDVPQFEIPKIHLNLDMGRLCVAVNKAQYRDIIALMESMDRMQRGLPYRKYRPNLTTYRGHYVEWWHFAYKCILEEEVRRKRRNWDWQNISEHRTVCKNYADLYKKKIKGALKEDEKKCFDDCEKLLHMVNIVIIRQRVELETERSDKLQQTQGRKSMFGWLWGGSQQSNQSLEENAPILKQFQNAMTPKEKERMYQAIGYQESAAPTPYPKHYIDTSCTFVLHVLEVELLENERILFSELKGVKCKLESRSAASALKVHLKIDEFQIFGLTQNDFTPNLVTSEISSRDNSLLEVIFETNPLDNLCGQRLIVVTQPLRIVYDALTVNKAIDIFKIPQSSNLEQLSAAAGSSLTNIKEMSVSGLQHTIDMHQRFDLQIDFHAPYVIIPYGGRFTETENVFIMNFGNLKVTSVNPSDQTIHLKELHAQGLGSEEKLQSLISQSYDVFNVEVNNIQILIAQSSEDWRSVMKNSIITNMHILQPVNVNINLFKCLITDDPRLPLMKITGVLPSINFTVSDARLLLLIALGTSIPLPQGDIDNQPLSKGLHRSSSMLLGKFIELQDKAQKTKELLPTNKKESSAIQYTTVDLKFVMSEICLCLQHQDSVESPLTNVAKLSLQSIESDLLLQTYNVSVGLRLGSIGFQQYDENLEIYDIITTPKPENSTLYLFEASFMKVDKSSPEFRSTYKSCETSLSLIVSKINVVLHQEHLLSLITYAKTLQSEIVEVQESETAYHDRIATTHDLRRLSISSQGTSNLKQMIQQERKKKKKLTIVETIKFKLSAELKELNVEFATAAAKISTCTINGLKGNIMVKLSYTQVSVNLNHISIYDLNPESIHKKILTITGDEALAAQVVLYNIDETDTDKVDMSVSVTIGGSKIVFLNWFINRMLGFLNNFQAAQDKIIEASQAAAQSAKENVQAAYMNATKILLDIKMKAPDIVVPTDSKSNKGFLLDMGQLLLTNRFTTLDAKNEQGLSAVLDELNLKLTDFKLMRIDINDDVNEICTLLQPVTFSLLIKRNLSTSWYRELPDIDISGKLHTISLFLTHSDYHLAMSVLSGNLTEGAIPSKKKSVKKALPEEGSTKQNVVAQVTSHTETTQSKSSSTVADTKVYTFLHFTFTMEKLIISLFNTPKGKSKEALPQESNGLARLCLEGLSLRGRILTNDIIITSVLLVNCILDDTRPGREGKLCRLIERKPEVTSSDKSANQALKTMIDATFQMKQEDMFIDVRVFSFTLILSIDYLLKLGDFFKLESDGANTQKLVAKSSTSTKKVKSNTSTVQESQTAITINLKVEKPDLILVESMDHLDVNAVIMNAEIFLKYRMASDHQVINGSLKDLQLFTCIYNPVKRAKTCTHILRPVCISVAGSTPEGRGLHIELMVTDIRISVTPASIELVNKVLIAMTTSDAAIDAGEEEIADHSKIWDLTTCDENEWYFNQDVDYDAIDLTSEPSIESLRSPKKQILNELCIVSVPSIVITIEAGVGNKTVPMIMLESGFKGSVRNWSSQMFMDGSMVLLMGYYNNRLALWEPLIEPVEIKRDNKSVYVPWELKVEVSQNEPNVPTSPTSGSNQSLSSNLAVMNIDLISDNNLELTVTKTCLEVLDNLSKAFADAMKSGAGHHVEQSYTYKVINDLGFNIILQLDKGAFKICGNIENDEVILEDKSEVPLVLKDDIDTTVNLQLGKNLTFDSQKIKEKFVAIKIPETNNILQLPVVRADKRYFSLNFHRECPDTWGLISDVFVDDGVTIVTLRSILKVYNHFNISIDVYYMTSKGNELESVAVIQPNSSINIPLRCVYTPTNELFFAVDGYSVTTAPYIWKDLQTNLKQAKVLQCLPREQEQGKESFFIKTVGEMEQVYYENSARHTMASTCYNIHLTPCVTFKNYLPINIICCVENLAEEVTVAPADIIQLPNIDVGKSSLIVRLPDYLEKEWSCRQDIQIDNPEFSVWTFYSYDSQVRMSLDLGMHVELKNHTVLMTLYCPFWMLNKTGLGLAYRKSKKAEQYESHNTKSPAKGSEDGLNVLYHPADFKGPILFSFNAKHFFGKKKISVRVDQSAWSDKFSIDVAGSSGVVSCKSKDLIHLIGVENRVTYSGLTKQITFTPYYVIINDTPFTIECQENDRPADPWIEVAPKSCSALWPKSELEDKLMRIRVEGFSELSAPFLYTESHTTLLKLKNQCGAINVDIQLTEGAVYICFASYNIGMAPALLVNATPFELTYWEKTTPQTRILPPKHRILYTWENPSGARVLSVQTGPKKELNSELRKDDVGQFKLDKDGPDIFWVSFLDGMQRILLFTDNWLVVQNVQSASIFETIDRDITVSIHGVGLSLVNNETHQEVLYIGIASSGIIWEEAKIGANRFKPISAKESAMIEAGYQRYLLNSDDEGCSRCILDSKTEVDFHQNMMYKPHTRNLRRIFQTGLWIQMKSSTYQLQLHAKINRLQIDNQMYDCLFPIVLAPVPIPKSVAAQDGNKPFIELSIVQLLTKNSQIKQYKYFKVLIQEFHVKVDLGLINALLEVTQYSESTELKEKDQFHEDMKLVDEPLYSHVFTQSLQEQKSFYDLLHLSPLKIHVSFSMGSGSANSQMAEAPNFLKVILQGIGVTLTDMQDVIFKLRYFERTFIFLTRKQLSSEVTSHYTGQLVKQLYVLVLGLDVLGNPFGLVLGLKKGVEDLFYEPFQGAIQGPGEFAEGLALGMRSLLGHTIGGAAGAFSRITGAVGKGIATLTFDDDYQRKRRDLLNKKPANIQEGIARSGKGLVMGVVDGISGVVMKPITGARDEGVGGFFKGLGKGAIGLVARPTAGVVDFASGSFEAVKRCADISEEIQKLRLPRLIHADGHVTPYNYEEAEGKKLLMDLEKGKYAGTDNYVKHYTVVDKKEYLLLTDKRLAYVTLDVFGSHQIDWFYTWPEIVHPLKMVSKGILISGDAKKKKLSLLGGSDGGKIILITDPGQCEEIIQKVESLRGNA